MSEEREVIAGPLPFLEDLLWEWVTIQERFLRLSNGTDALWWYNERTSLGALAGAVWRAGGVVSRRANAVSERRRAHYVGRTIDGKNRRPRWSGKKNSEQRYRDGDTRSVVFLGAL
jgi:hypothetical protein